MKNKNYLILLFAIIVIIQCKKDYIKTIENYFKYLKNEKYDKVYDLLSSKDKKLISLEEYVNDQDSTPISKNIIKRIKYNIIDSKLSETKKNAFIRVEIRQPDLVKIYTILPELLNIENNQREVDRIFQINSKIIENNFITIFENYKLVFEEGRWLIDADFEKKKYLYELLEEADKYYKDYDYKEALEKYEEILDFNKNDNFVLDRIIKIKEKLFYIEKFIKFDYEILKKSKNGVIINITIKNNGTIVVKKVGVVFLFYFHNKIIHIKKQQLFNNQQLGFNEKIIKEIVIDELNKEFKEVKCKITAIEF